MTQKRFFVLILTFGFSLTSLSQTYEYDTHYKICSESLSKFSHVDSLYLELAQKRDSCLIGVEAPNFQVTTSDHKNIELSKLKGHVVVLDFWFTQCLPCMEEIPGFNKLVESYSNKKVIFISITYDSLETVRKFLKQHPFKFNTVTDNDEVRHETFKLFAAWPYTLIINKEGQIAYMQFGSKGAETFDYFSKIINQLL